jgi:hypothetical protein
LDSKQPDIYPSFDFNSPEGIKDCIIFHQAYQAWYQISIDDLNISSDQDIDASLEISKFESKMHIHCKAIELLKHSLDHLSVSTTSCQGYYTFQLPLHDVILSSEFPKFDPQYWKDYARDLTIAEHRQNQVRSIYEYLERFELVFQRCDLSLNDNWYYY